MDGPDFELSYLLIFDLSFHPKIKWRIFIKELVFSVYPLYMKKSILNQIPNEKLQTLFDNNNSISSILGELNLSKSCRHSRKILKKRMVDLDLTRFNELRAKKSPFKSFYKKYKDEDMFKLNSDVDVKTIKRRFCEKNLPLKCECCKIENKWNNKPLTLQFDHKNGNNKDNRLENLRWLCPNCHSQTETYTGKNNKKMVSPVGL